jgi:hypothetical protein
MQSSAKQEALVHATLLLFIAFMALAGGTRKEPVETSRARKAQIASVQMLLGLEYPYSIERLEMSFDGGSYGGMIRDARGTELEFGWDGGIRFGTHAQEPRLSYVEGTGPANSGARSFGVGTPEEKALVFVLRSFADSQIKPALQDSLFAIRFDYTLTSEQRVELLGLNDKQHLALDAIWIARYLERQAGPGGLKGWPWPKPP